jgi:3-mercaptopyruvate sulfurtransferase SseA
MIVKEVTTGTLEGGFVNLFTQFFGGGSVLQQDPQDVKARLGQSQKPFLLDVRQPEEFLEGHIAGARIIPLSELNRRMKDISRYREIVCVCRSGSRSSSAARLQHMVQISNLAVG